MQSRFLSSLLRLPVMAITLLAASIAQAQIPQTLNYQGFLTNASSQPVNAAVNVTFRIYTAASGGSPVWSETQSGVGVINGIYNAVLGSVTPLALPFNVPYFLSLQVNADAEMSGRQPLSAVPYALRAVSADAVAASATIPATQLTGTLASNQFAATQLLPTTACAANQFSQWNGTAWICAAGTGTSTTSDVTGNLTMVNSTAKAGNILKGGTPFIHNFGTGNTFIGEGAGTLALTGMNNTATGFRALGANTFGQSNTAIGAAALFSNTGGYDNTASGAGALNGNVDGAGNTAIGSQALVGNVSGGDNTAIGKGALKFGSGNNNIGLGVDAGSASETGSNNIAIGNAGQVADSGVVRIGTSGLHGKAYVAGIRGVTPGIADALPVVIDSSGQLGTGAVAGGVTSITTGSGLTGGTITSSGTIGLAATQLLPVASCAANQYSQWNGTAWICAAGTGTGMGTVTSITAGAGLTGGTITASGTIAIDPASSVLTGNFFKQGGNDLLFGAILGNKMGGVEIIANNKRAMSIQSATSSPNITFGHATNLAGGNGISGATVSGGGIAGFPNLATESYAFVGGGLNNKAQFAGGTIGGGTNNTAGGEYASVGGGNLNKAIATNSTVAGGDTNTASGFNASVGGGSANNASGGGATVPGGSQNSATGTYSFAAGYRAKAVNAGCFAWADSTNTDLACTTDNAFVARASGGVYFFSSAGLATGCQIPAGGGAWACASSRETKTDFAKLNPLEVLARVADLPMTEWRYRTEESKARHVGPMAEDFHAAFGLGDSTKTINVMDASGVALTAIQGLHQLVKDRDREIDALKRDLAAIKKKLGLD